MDDETINEAVIELADAVDSIADALEQIDGVLAVQLRNEIEHARRASAAAAKAVSPSETNPTA